MRKRLVSVVVAMLLGIPLTAMAAQPVVVVDDTFTYGPEVRPVLSGYCGFEVMAEGSESVRVTEFFDNDDNFVKATVHVHGTVSYWTDHGEANENFALSISFFPDGSQVVLGNVWNVHDSTGRLLIQDSGRVVFDDMGEIATVNGPHEELLAFYEVDDSGVQDFCAALAP
jgi:hypothetical protein